MKFALLIKRIVPFLATLTLGLFVASFFVTITAPRFSFSSGGRKHREFHRQMKFENQQLREENERLRQRLDEIEKRDWVLGPDFDVQPPPPPAVQPLNAIPNAKR